MSNVDKHAPGTPSWFDLMTPDLEGARKFYGDLFGWTFDVGAPEMGYYTMCKLDGRNAAGMGKRPDDAPYPTAWSIYFSTENADASAAAIREAGGQVMMGPMDVMEQGRMLVAVDPTGATFGFWQPMRHTGAQVREEHGAMCWAEAYTRAPEKTAPFYSKVLGAEAKKIEGMEYSTFSVNGAMCCGMMHMDAKWPAEIPPHWMVYFTVNDINAAVETVKSRGGKIHQGPFPSPYGQIAIVADPWGASFAVIESPKS